MRYFKKLLYQTFNKDIMKDIKNDTKNDIMQKRMNMTKARLYKAFKSNNQTRKKTKANKKLLTHANTICNRVNRQFNLRHNTFKNWT